MDNITLCFFQALKEEKTSTAAEAVPMARPEPHFIRIQSWWARIDPQAKRLSVAVPSPCLHIKFQLIKQLMCQKSRAAIKCLNGM